MTERGGYALDLLTPVRHVATEMERAAPDGAAPTIEAMTATYQHTIAGDLARIREHEGAPSDYEARLWLIGRAVRELGRQVTSDGDGYRLTKPFDDLKYQGRKVQRWVRAGTETEKQILDATYKDLATELRPFHVTVIGARGNTREVDLPLHPLAHDMPRMTKAEFAELAGDMKENGFRKQLGPILTIKGKVIDGRHRLAIGSALKIPVLVEEYGGTEEEAVGHIFSANVLRRHMNSAQRTLLVRKHLLPAAEAEAAKAQTEAQERGRQTRAGLASTEANPKPGKKASQIAAERSSGMTSAASIERQAGIEDAPRTQERIVRGDITSNTKAAEAIAEELGKPVVKPPLKSQSAWEGLGDALYAMKRAVESLEAGDKDRSKPGKTDAEFIKRLTEIRTYADQIEKLLQ